MEIVYFTLVAIVLYVACDRGLDLAERVAGRRFEHRSVIFFAVLLTLALISFNVIQNLAEP